MTGTPFGYPLSPAIPRGDMKGCSVVCFHRKTVEGEAKGCRETTAMAAGFSWIIGNGTRMESFGPNVS